MEELGEEQCDAAVAGAECGRAARAPLLLEWLTARLRAIVRALILGVVRFFHRQIAVRGIEHLPAEGPVLIVANHPNGLIDPIVIRLALGREVGFMAKAPLLENPWGRLSLGAFDAVPVYRAKDGRDTSANEKTFAAVRARFGEGRWVVIFPEGHSHSEPSLQRLKTGAARIVLGYEAQKDFSGGTSILPVGLVYEDKEHFRSRVAVNAGAPIAVAPFAESWARDERQAAVELTDAIAAALSSVMLEAESDEVWRGFLAIARWTMPEAVHDVSLCERRARELARAYRQMLTQEPERAEALAEEARRFVRMLDAVGVDDPFSLEPPRAPAVGQLVVQGVKLALGAPIAALGWLLNGPPYYGIGPLARRIAGDELDIISSVKAIAGLLFYPLTWLVWGALGVWAGAWWLGALIFAAGPVTGLIAVRYFERLALRREALVGVWLRLSRKEVVQAVLARRAELAEKIEGALAVIPADEPQSAG